MEKKNHQYGVCGVYCGQCPNGNGRVKMIAGELKRLVDTVRYDWVQDVVKSFKFEEFRKRIEPRKVDLPDELADGMSLTFDAVLDLLRIRRNDAGHPTGKPVLREDQYISLQMFARYLQRLYQFRAFFLSASP